MSGNINIGVTSQSCCKPWKIWKNQGVFFLKKIMKITQGIGFISLVKNVSLSSKIADFIIIV